MDYQLPKKQDAAFKRALVRAKKQDDVEKSVERAVINLLEGYYENHPKYNDVSTTYPHHCDGLVEASAGLFANSIRILVEAKRDKNFAGNKRDVAGVLAQVCGYLRRFKEDTPELYPSVAVIADNDEIFLVPVSALEVHALGDYDYSRAPSDMSKDRDLVDALMQDKNIRPVIHDISTNFETSQFVSQMQKIAEGAKYEVVKVDKDSLVNAFGSFRNLVFGTNENDVIDADNRQQIELFTRTLAGDDDVFVHPKKHATIFIDSEKIDNISGDGYEQFCSMFDANSYSLAEYKTITENSDTLLEEANRRFKGDFYTPKIWVDKAHEMISNELGDTWKETHVVWDMAAGTKNLTRDYRFTGLYSSTLYEGEIMATKNYNKNNVAFQYDFLNDDMELHDGSLSRDDLVGMSDEELEATLKMPVSLVRDLLEKKPVVFFTNPPYGQGSSGQGNMHKSGAAHNSIGYLMKNEKMGHASGELYTQFIYRMQLLADFFEYEDEDDLHMFLFSSAKFIPSPNFGKFVTGLTRQFHFHDGFMMNAGEFSGTSSAWGIIFSHWSLDGGKNQREFAFDVLRSNDEGNIEKIDEWNGKKVEKRDTISDWLNDVAIGTQEDSNAPLTANGFDASKRKDSRCKMKQGWIGYFLNDSSTVHRSSKYVSLYTMGYQGANGRDITKDNFVRAAVAFSIRRAVYEHYNREKSLWYHWEDIFTRLPDDLLTDEFIADCVTYALFDTKSRQTSLRDYQYNGNSYRVINEFFPFSRDWVDQVASRSDINNIDIQSDLVGDHDRYAYTWLQDHDKDISPQARKLIAQVKNLYEASFADRDAFQSQAPRYQTNTWDAGYTQIARMCFGNERISDAYLDLKKPLYDARTALGERIAQAAFEHNVI